MIDSSSFHILGSNFCKKTYEAFTEKENSKSLRKNYLKNLNAAGKVCFYAYATSTFECVITFTYHDKVVSKIDLFNKAVMKLRNAENLFLLQSGIQFERIMPESLMESIKIPWSVLSCSEAIQHKYRVAYATLKAVHVNSERYFVDSSMDCD